MEQHVFVKCNHEYAGSDKCVVLSVPHSYIIIPTVSILQCATCIIFVPLHSETSPDVANIYLIEYQRQFISCCEWPYRVWNKIHITKIDNWNYPVIIIHRLLIYWEVLTQRQQIIFLVPPHEINENMKFIVTWSDISHEMIDTVSQMSCLIRTPFGCLRRDTHLSLR